MEATLDIAAVNELLKLAHTTTEDAKKAASSPIMTRCKAKLKQTLPEVAEKFNQLTFSAFSKLGKKSFDVQGSEDPEQTEKTAVPLIINWIVSLLKDIISKLNDQGDLIGSLISKLGELVDPKEALEAEFKKKHEDLEADFLEKSDSFEKIVRDKQDTMEKEFKLKHENMDKKCDEA